jgi:hypothetical protein
LTENPKCVLKDQGGECPSGQSLSTATNATPGACAPDDDPDHKCGTDTFNFKDIGKDGKIAHSCRSTPEKEKAKQQKVADAQKVITERNGKQAADEREK